MKINGFKFQVAINCAIGSYTYSKELKEGRKHNEALEGFDFNISFGTEVNELHVEGKEIAEAMEGFAKAISETTRAEADKALVKCRARTEEARARAAIRMEEEDAERRRNKTSN